jgi:dynein heavy chain
MHESQRVYGDKLVDEKDIEAFSKIQIDIVKKNFEVSTFEVNIC